MELQLIGKADAPKLLLLGAPDALAALKDSYLLLLPSFTERSEEEKLAALEKALLLEHGGRIRGIYAYGEAASLALGLYARRRVRMRAVVLESIPALPEELPGLPGPVWYWFRKKDRSAKKIREALKGAALPLSTLCMKKLPKETALADVRADLAAARLKAVFGGGVCVTRAGMVPGRMEALWDRLTMQPAGAEAALLTKQSPIVCDEEEHIQILEGSSDRLSYWSHLIRLEEADDELTYVTDQVELEAGKLNGLASPLSELYLWTEHLRRTLAMKKVRHAL